MRKKQSYHSSFAQTLLLSVLSLFFFFFLCMISYQYQREKEYKVGLMFQKLQDYNQRIIEELNRDHLFDSINNQCSIAKIEQALNTFLPSHSIPQLRITIITNDGKVIYDNEKKKYDDLKEQWGRPEIRKALKYGRGDKVLR